MSISAADGSVGGSPLGSFGGGREGEKGEGADDGEKGEGRGLGGGEWEGE